MAALISSADNAPSVGQSETGIIIQLDKSGVIKSSRNDLILLPVSEISNLQESNKNNSRRAKNSSNNLPIEVGAKVKFILGRNHQGWVAQKCSIIQSSSSTSSSSEIATDSNLNPSVASSIEALGKKSDNNHIKKAIATLSKPFLVKNNQSDAASIEELVDSTDATAVHNYLHLFTQVVSSRKNSVAISVQPSVSELHSDESIILHPQFWEAMSPERMQWETLRQFSLTQLQLLTNDTNSHFWKETYQNFSSAPITSSSSSPSSATASRVTSSVQSTQPQESLCEICVQNGERKIATIIVNDSDIDANIQCTCRLIRIKSNYTAAAEQFLTPLSHTLFHSLDDSSPVAPASITTSEPFEPSSCLLATTTNSKPASITSKQGNKKRAKVEDNSKESSNLPQPQSQSKSQESLEPKMTPTSLLSLIQSMHTAIADQLLDNPGRFRDNKNARCGHETFIPHTQLPAALKSFTTYVIGKLLPRNDLQCYTKAAMVMYQFIRIHPFSDGNGRVSRMLGNWMLMKSGLPFPVQFCPTRETRKEYVAACRYVDSRMMCKYVANCVASACRLYDVSVQAHMASALRNWNNILSESRSAIQNISDINQSSSSSDAIPNDPELIAKQRETELAQASVLVFADEDRVKEAATIHRKRQQLEAECVICFETDTSITLHCCGSPCHVACLSRWRLTQRQEGAKKCPYCRQAYHGTDQAEMNREEILSEVLAVPAHVSRSLLHCVSMYDRGVLNPMELLGGIMGLAGANVGIGGAGGEGMVNLGDEDDEDTSSTFDDDDSEEDDDEDEDDEEEDDENDESSTATHDDNTDDDMPDLVGSGSDDDSDDQSMPNLVAANLLDDDSDDDMPDMIDDEDDEEEDEDSSEWSDDDEDDDEDDDDSEETSETSEDDEEGVAIANTVYSRDSVTDHSVADRLDDDDDDDSEATSETGEDDEEGVVIENTVYSRNSADEHSEVDSEDGINFKIDESEETAEVDAENDVIAIDDSDVNDEETGEDDDTIEDNDTVDDTADVDDSIDVSDDDADNVSDGGGYDDDDDDDDETDEY